MIASGTTARTRRTTRLDRSPAGTKLDKSMLSVIVPIFDEEATLPELGAGCRVPSRGSAFDRSSFFSYPTAVATAPRT